MRMPAEWEAHAATWVAWPHNLETWPGCMEEAEEEFEALVRILASYEPVNVIVQHALHARYVSERISGNTRHPVQLFELATDDSWLRDIGPTFVEADGAGSIAIDWIFNSWGGKYPPWQRDDSAAGRIAAFAKIATRRVDWVAEGGALEVDGEGTLLAVERTLLSATRNPGRSRSDLEHAFRELLGVREFIWLPSGIAGDDTDGHIDDLARFTSPGRVICCTEPNSRDPNHAALAECRAILAASRDANGRPLEVVDLPMPPPLESDGGRLPASYANFSILNDAVLVPSFGLASDDEAVNLLTPLFPGREVRPVRCRALVRGLGAVHCLTQQQPIARNGPLRS